MTASSSDIIIYFKIDYSKIEYFRSPNTKRRDSFDVDEAKYLSSALSEKLMEEEIGKIKNNRLSPDEFVSAKVNADAFREIYRAYEEKRKSLRKIDFDDMLVVCYELFASRPDILALWQKKFKFILVDEFQDINRVQYDVIRMLALPENNLYVVGDDDQAIYGFRGADSELMFQFREDYPDARHGSRLLSLSANRPSLF